MKILLIADEADPMLWEHLDKRRLDGVELILSAGDLPASYLSFLTCFTTAPIVYVPGNHDASYEKKPPLGCLNADGRIIEANGLRILGLGGSMRYKNGPFMYSEEDMARRIQRLKYQLWRNRGFDILLTHAPMRHLGDMEDLPHQGFECFKPLLETYQPSLFAYAHVHGNYGRDFLRRSEFGSTLCVNGYMSYTIELDFPSHEKPRIGKPNYGFDDDQTIPRRRR